jgi:hypothetical protein
MNFELLLRKGMKDEAPIVLELAPLPREQVGPFLLLGLDKDADRERVEAHWARRVIWARRNQLRVALQDIHWAREVLSNPERRVRADAAGLNPDTAEGVVRRLARRYGADGTGPTWQPLGAAGPPPDVTPRADVPDPQAVRAAVTVPPVPREFPFVAVLLEQLSREPLDPWGVRLPEAEGVRHE